MPYQQKHPYLSQIWYMIKYRLHETRQKLCCHRFRSIDTRVHYDQKHGTITITETCVKCGKRFSFTATEKAFGLPERR